MISPPITLRIAEARTKDVGRAIARIDPQEFSKIRVDMGNTVALKSKKAETVMKVMPAYPEMRGQKINEPPTSKLVGIKRKITY